MRWVQLGVLVVLVSVGAACSGGSPGSQDPTDSGGQAGTANLPAGSRVYRSILNLVDADTVAALDQFIETGVDNSSGTSEPPALAQRTEAFYQLFGNDYDFLIFVADHDVPGTIAGKCTTVNRPAIPGTGLDMPLYMSGMQDRTRLKGLIGVEMVADPTTQYPPFAHEVMHLWGNHLDTALGLGVESESHWGATSVHGVLGGFDESTLECVNPAGAKPPDCQPESTGRYRYRAELFGLNANLTTDEFSYAPLELYLMGLLSASEVPSRFLHLLDGAVVIDPEAASNGQTIVEASGTAEIQFADIVARHRERPAVPEDQRHFRAAFVLATTEPAPDDILDIVADWAAGFGGRKQGQAIPRSFAEMTGGRATMDTELGQAGAAVPGGQLPGSGCDLIAQDCDPGLSCSIYGTETRCMVTGTGARDEVCISPDDCGPGLACVSSPANPSVGQCAPYCDGINDDLPQSCETLCPLAQVDHLDDDGNVWAMGCRGGAGPYCDPLVQDCGAGKGCYGIARSACGTAGTIPAGQECSVNGSAEQCEPGSSCFSYDDQIYRCYAFCDADPNSTRDNACSLLCPDNYFDGVNVGSCR